MLGLITNREQENVDRLNALAAKGWNGMTEAERAEWTGDILSPTLAGYTEPVNLLPNNNYYSSSVDLEFRNKSVTAKAQSGGTYLYAVVIVGDAANFENKTMTLSVKSVESFDGGSPHLIPYWHDENGYEGIPVDYSGDVLGEFVLGESTLATPGGFNKRVTFNTGANTGGRAYLALYIYVTMDVAVEAGAAVRYNGLMLEMGDERHEYTPYTEALPTAARKGAYNYCDLNRVERTTKELAEMASITALTFKTDWKAWDIPKQADLARVLENIRRVQQVSVPDSVLALPRTMRKLTYTAANDIEKVLLEIENSLVATEFRSGELYCGEV
jgi:hypothetical protein